jgi:hypothetical protein
VSSYTIPYTILTILLSIIFGISATLLIVRVKEIRAKSAGLGLIGVILGGLAGSCPGCYFGLFPLVMSFFGISATLAILPLHGLELQVLAIIALCASVITLARSVDPTCDLPAKAKRK